MQTSENCNAINESDEGYTYIRGRCKQFGQFYSSIRGNRLEPHSSDYELVALSGELSATSIDGFREHSEDICRRVSMSVF